MNKLVTVTNEDLINDLRKYDNITLLYPLKSFCVGYDLTFNVNVIDDFVLINRILNDSELDELATILNNSHIKGILFDDLGIIDIIKDMDITKILLLDHLATNTASINYYLDYVDSVVVSNDLTEAEIRSIVSDAKSELVVNVFGLKTLMYSRRTLLTNYELHHKLPIKNNLEVSIDNSQFKIKENEFGTKFYAYPYYNALSLLDLDNVLYFWYDCIDLESNEIKSIVIDNDTTDIPTTNLFLDKKTVYKVGDLDE